MHCQAIGIIDNYILECPEFEAECKIVGGLNRMQDTEIQGIFCSREDFGYLAEGLRLLLKLLRAAEFGN